MIHLFSNDYCPQDHLLTNIKLLKGILQPEYSVLELDKSHYFKRQ